MRYCSPFCWYIGAAGFGCGGAGVTPCACASGAARTKAMRTAVIRPRYMRTCHLLTRMRHFTPASVITSEVRSVRLQADCGPANRLRQGYGGQEAERYV